MKHILHDDTLLRCGDLWLLILFLPHASIVGDNRVRTERERDSHKECLYSYTRQQLQNDNNQPLQKVTKSLYIVTHLGQLPFRLFTQMARTWALKEDSVNTSIIHWYSTLSSYVHIQERLVHAWILFLCIIYNMLPFISISTFWLCRIPMYNGRIHTILFECPSSGHLCK